MKPLTEKTVRLLTNKLVFGIILICLPILLAGLFDTFYFVSPYAKDLYNITKIVIYILLMTLGIRLIKPFLWPIVGPVQALFIFFVLPFIAFFYSIVLFLTLTDSTKIEVLHFNEHEIHIKKLSVMNESSIGIYEACPFFYAYYFGRKIDFINNGIIDSFIINSKNIEYKIGKAYKYPDSSTKKVINDFNSSCMKPVSLF